LGLVTPSVAEMFALPTRAALARPCEPTALETTTFAESEFQVTVVVMFAVLPSEYVPVATYCTVVPFAAVVIPAGFVVTAIDVRVAAVTVRSTFGLTINGLVPGIVAVMFAVPTVRAEARPWVPVAFEIVATATVSEAHVTEVERSFVLPSVYVPVATY
jgi:hypothetical protein